MVGASWGERVGAAPMKRVGAAVAAASVAIATSATTFSVYSAPQHDSLKMPDSQDGRAGEKGQCDRFAPRFDGLRFIETLVTAHR